MAQAAWTVEWTGWPGSCSPCSGYTITEQDLEALGYEGSFWDHHLTRLHVRYTPETADVDLMLYESGISDAKVTSFADNNGANHRCLDVCGEPTDAGEGEGEGMGDGGGPGGGEDSPAGTADEGGEKSSAGCTTVPGAWAGWLACLGILGVGMRRRD